MRTRLLCLNYKLMKLGMTMQEEDTLGRNTRWKKGQTLSDGSVILPTNQKERSDLRSQIGHRGRGNCHPVEIPSYEETAATWLERVILSLNILPYDLYDMPIREGGTCTVCTNCIPDSRPHHPSPPRVASSKLAIDTLYLCLVTTASRAADVWRQVCLCAQKDILMTFHSCRSKRQHELMQIYGPAAMSWPRTRRHRIIVPPFFSRIAL